MNHQPAPILDGTTINTTYRRRAAELWQSALALDGNADRVVLVKLVDLGANQTMAVMPSFPIQMTALLIAVMREAFNLSSRSPSWPTRPKHCARGVLTLRPCPRSTPTPIWGSKSVRADRAVPPLVGAFFADKNGVPR
ncbi:MAG TPA: hypothetical protein VMY41_11265 [Thermohalobaculum sp.]|nr:hypothetical protein [Thermohalobaculum sp.]